MVFFVKKQNKTKTKTKVVPCMARKILLYDLTVNGSENMLMPFY